MLVAAAFWFLHILGEPERSHFPQDRGAANVSPRARLPPEALPVIVGSRRAWAGRRVSLGLASLATFPDLDRFR